MGDKDSRGFVFGDRRCSEHARAEAPGQGSGKGSYDGDAGGGLKRNLGAPGGEPLRARIQRALQRDPRIPEEGIQIAVDAGRVTLTGIVRSESAKRAATEMVQALPEVREVINDIQVIV